MKVEFTADLVKIRGPKVDGGFAVTFEVGEYETAEVLSLPLINGEIIKVVVESGHDTRQAATSQKEVS